jgi:hypothetical protein
VAFSHAKSAVVYLNGYNLTTYFQSAGVDASADLPETTTFGSEAKAYIPGIDDATFKAEGFYDPTAGATADKLEQALNVAQGALSYYPTGDTSGNPGIGMYEIGTKYEINSDVSDANKVSAEFQSSKGFEPVVSVRALATTSAAGTSSVVDNAAASTGGAVGYLQATSCVGGTLTPKIQHSTDNSTYVDLLTFTAVTPTTAGTAERVSPAGTTTVYRYSRVVWTLPAGTAFFNAALGRRANT